MKLIDNVKSFKTNLKNMFISGNNSSYPNRTPISFYDLFSSINHSTEELCIGTVYSCIDFRSKSLAKAIPVLYRNDEAEDNPEVEDHEFINVLETPNQNLSRAELMINTLANMDIYGDAYWFLLKTKKYNSLREIHILNPKFVQISIDYNTGLVNGYNYSFVDSGKTQNIFYDVNDVIHFKHQNYINSSSPYGLSIIKQNALVLNIFLEMTVYQSNFLNHDGIPRAYLQAKDNPSAEQIKAIKEQFQGLYAGSKNAGKLPILEGGMTFEKLSLSPKELDYIESFKLFQKQVYEMFQVPEVLLGTSQTVNRSTSQTHLTSFYQNTIEPMLNVIDEKCNLYLKLNYKKDNIFLKHKLPDIIDPDLEYKTLSFGLQNGAISIEEYRKYLHYSGNKTVGTYLTPNNSGNTIDNSGTGNDNANDMTEEQPV
ncbi:MAG: phage portal protein [Ignavibacteria bacterium]|nr:phage portal protein [Ignavibacteria bacterium]